MHVHVRLVAIEEQVVGDKAGDDTKEYRLFYRALLQQRPMITGLFCKRDLCQTYRRRRAGYVRQSR